MKLVLAALLALQVNTTGNINDRNNYGNPQPGSTSTVSVNAAATFDIDPAPAPGPSAVPSAR